MRNYFGYIFFWNLKQYRIKSLLFWTGIGRYEYSEFSYVLSRLPRRKSKVLEVGCGHSILNKILTSLSYFVVSIDISFESVHWQNLTSSDFNGVVADARHLPFIDGSFDFVTAISSLEHIPDIGDKQAAYEIGKILGSDGLAIITVPGSRRAESLECNDLLGGIPPRLKSLISSRSSLLFKIFEVDRGSSWFQRSYSINDAFMRLIPNSCNLVEAQGVGLRAGMDNWIHKVLPIGTNAVLEWIIVHLMVPVNLTETRNSEMSGTLCLTIKPLSNNH